MNKLELIKNWTKENEPAGIELGYPKCCIKEFCEQPPQLMKGNPTKDDKRRLKASYVNGKYSGFIPCKVHAKEITMGKTKLVDLISNRDNDLLPFPYA